jgi:putative membrane protein
METVSTSIVGLPLFLAYLGTAAVLTGIYIVVYMWVTPHAEIKLIRENNLAAAVAFAGSLIGFSLPLANTIAGSVSLVDCAIWGLIALVVQILIYFIARIPMPKMSARIEKGEMASGVWLGSASLSGGLLNAACMSY